MEPQQPLPTTSSSGGSDRRSEALIDSYIRRSPEELIFEEAWVPKHANARRPKQIETLFYLTTDAKGQRCIAKVSHIKGVSSAFEIESARLEARLIGGGHFQHPNIVAGMGFVEGPERILLAMEYAEGGDMLRFLLKHQLGECHARWIARQIFSALAYVHAMGYLHNDVKLENILVRDTPRLGVVLADFGFVNTATECALMKPRGSVSYSAPECLEGQPNSVASDSWAAGVVFYALIRRHMPFEESKSRDLIKTIRTCHPRFLGPDRAHQWEANFPSYRAYCACRSLIERDVRLRRTVARAAADPYFASAEMPLHMPVNICPLGEEEPLPVRSVGRSVPHEELSDARTLPSCGIELDSDLKPAASRLENVSEGAPHTGEPFFCLGHTSVHC